MAKKQSAVRPLQRRTMALDDTRTETIKHLIYSHIELGSHLHTDEAPVYADLDGLFYRHDAINHGLRQYRRKDVTTNSVESAFAVLKRGIIGVYHHITPKHTDRYVDEFAFRLTTFLGRCMTFGIRAMRPDE